MTNVNGQNYFFQRTNLNLKSAENSSPKIGNNNALRPLQNDSIDTFQRTSPVEEAKPVEKTAPAEEATPKVETKPTEETPTASDEVLVQAQEKTKNKAKGKGLNLGGFFKKIGNWFKTIYIPKVLEPVTDWFSDAWGTAKEWGAKAWDWFW